MKGSVKLNNIEWGEFVLHEIVEIQSSAEETDEINLNIATDGKYPYVTRSSNTNGYKRFIPEQNFIKTNNHSLITIGLDTQTIFYQPHIFYTGQNIQVINYPCINKYNANFLISILKQALQKFSWGSYGATLTRLKGLRLLLPNKNNQPDWQFMEDYMRQIEADVLEKELKHFEKKLLTTKPVKSLQEITWEEFFITDIFNIHSGVRLTKSNMILGDRPFIGSTEFNNGITNFVENSNNSLDSNVLGVNYNGSVVENFYHPYEAVFSDDVKRLKLKTNANKHTYLFIKQLILQQKIKYMYAYKFNATRMEKQKILLPVKPDKTPDWDYMENYMKHIENKQITSWLKSKGLSTQ